MKTRLTFVLAAIVVGLSLPSIAETAIPSNGLNKYCQDEVQTMDEVYENGALTKCYFKGMTLLEAYQQYRAALVDGQQFLIEKPVVNKNMDIPCSSEGCIEVRYHWDGKQKLKVEQEFEGGETHLEFIQDNEGTALDVRQYPD
ncbi:TPA: hypothetical protein ACKRTE_000716 [Providencia rettgeri]